MDIRRFGSSSLDVCSVAEGLWDGYFEKGVKPWDISASSLIAKNAGCEVTDFNGYPVDFNNPSDNLLVGNINHREILNYL